MKIFILTMWLWGTDASLTIDAFSTLEKCEAVRPQYDRPYSFGHCASLEVK
jgi:hypothetical protein